jgi:general secretion pathway protein K
VTTRPSDQRGAALLTVMVSIAVLTAFAVDLAYQSRVSLQIAANSRDELRASWLARSGVSMARLVLSFQQQLDDAMPKGGPTPRIQIWNLVPVSSTLTRSLFGGASAQAAAAGGAAASSLDFDAKVEDEGRKVNAQLDTLGQTGDKKLWQRIQALYQLVCDARYDPLFEREDARGVKTTREDLLIRLKDWVDEDDRTSELVVASGSGTTCGMVPGQPPFVDAFGDENQPYDRGEDRYRVKNARMDSLDELYLVAGVGDAFMAAFGDQLTVYLPRDEKQNLNVLGKDELARNAALIADQRLQPKLLDPQFAVNLQKAVAEQTFGGLLSMTPQQFGAIAAAAGLRVNQTLLADSPNNPFTDRSTVFRIRAHAQAGVVQSSIDAVVRLERAPAGEPTAAPGRLVHWREE